jgi:hypothetical protein
VHKPLRQVKALGLKDPRAFFMRYSPAYQASPPPCLPSSPQGRVYAGHCKAKQPLLSLCVRSPSKPATARSIGSFMKQNKTYTKSILFCIILFFNQFYLQHFIIQSLCLIKIINISFVYRLKF